MISWLTEVELSSALAKKVRQDELSEQDARRVEELFRNHCNADLYQILSLQRADFVQARQWIGKQVAPLRTLDALHLALAEHQQLSLLTADQRMHDAANRLDIETTLIQDNLTS